jgi:hypothetical protein
MHLPLRGGGADTGGPPVPVESGSDSTDIVVGDTELLAPILERIVGALAARRDLSIERVSDAVLLTDAIAEAAPGRFADDRVKLAFEDDDDGLELRLGPMRVGGADEVRDSLGLPDMGGSLETLADDLRVEAAEDGDYLAIRFRSPAPAP